MSESQAPLLVCAKYKFAGKNNDELCFQKNDIITITQQLDGGWWEGTLNGKTGWFPSNYVTPVVDSDAKRSSRNKSPTGLRNIDLAVNVPNQSNKTVYRTIVLKDLIESERSHVAELQALFRDYLAPLRSAGVLSSTQYDQLVSNIEQIIEQQLSLLSSLEQNTQKPSMEQRVGGQFMLLAPTMKTLMKIYCQNHPNAVQIINENREKLNTFVQSQGAEMKTLVAGLSKPFRHLHKYPTTLQELERNMEEGHPDRGETQRAASIYRDLATMSGEIRKQKEMQFELLNSGVITGWQNADPISSLGDIKHMGTVAVQKDQTSGDKDDRCVVLFPRVILVLAITQQLNSYILARRLSLSGVTVHKTDSPNDNFILELKGGEEPLTLVFISSESMNHWLDALQSCDLLVVNDTCNTVSPTQPSKYDTVQGNLSPLIKPQVSQMPGPGHAELIKKSSTLPAKLDYQLQMIEPEPDTPGPEAYDATQGIEIKPRLWSGFCLLPHAAPRGNFAFDPRKAHVKMRHRDCSNDQEDALVLNVIETYCTTAATNKHLASGAVDSPQLLVAEDEKILVEVMDGDELIVEEKSLVDTVYSIKEQMNSLQEQVKTLSHGLEREQRARRRLEELYRRSNSHTNNPTSLPPLPAKQQSNLTNGI